MAVFLLFSIPKRIRDFRLLHYILKKRPTLKSSRGGWNFILATNVSLLQKSKNKISAAATAGI